MMIWFVVFFSLAFISTFFYFVRQWKRQISTSLEYHFEFSTEEVFVGEYLYLNQVVINNSDRPISYLKTETLLPQGLKIFLSGGEGKEDVLLQSVQSVFYLPPHSQVSRRWCITTETRGAYTARSVLVHAISHDTTGMRTYSQHLEPQPSSHGELLVLPAPAEWLTQMALSPSYTGEHTTTQGLIFDPMTVCGIRPYQVYDALNTVDWKQSARLGQMMVRKTEVQQNDSYNIVLNMQSVIVEPREDMISAPRYIEDCISICASLLDSAIRRNIPVRLMANTPPGQLLSGSYVNDDAIGKQIYQSEVFETKDSIMEAYRVLAHIPMSISVPFERLLDDVISHPQLYARGGNIIMVSAFLNQRMINFHRAMQEIGVKVIFYIVSSHHNVPHLPSDIEVYFRISQWVGGTGYAS